MRKDVEEWLNVENEYNWHVAFATSHQNNNLNESSFSYIMPTKVEDFIKKPQDNESSNEDTHINEESKYMGLSQDDLSYILIEEKEKI